jgi:hypothetical protein
MSVCELGGVGEGLCPAGSTQPLTTATRRQVAKSRPLSPGERVEGGA